MALRLLLASILLTASLITTTSAQAAIKHSIDIPAQGLGPALTELAKQTGIQFIYPAHLVTGLNARALTGSMTTEEALRLLLAETKLKYEFLDGRTVTLTSQPSGGAPDTTSTPAGASKNETTRAEPSLFSRVLRLAQASPSSEGSQSGDDSSRPAGDSAQRQADRPASDALGAIMVTAQKREENLRDVPISVSVLTGARLDGSVVQGVTEALNRVPGIAADGGYQPPVGTQLGARGVAAANGIFFGASTMGYYIDSVPFAFVKSAIVPDPNAYDLERVEVLRGPQGTLYGASALNGVVRVLTSDADLDGFSIKGRTAFSSTEIGGNNWRGDMALNVPIVEGKMAARAVVGYQDLSGWIDKPNRKDANDGELRNIRLKVNAQPTDALAIGLSAWQSESEFGAPSYSANGETSPVVREEPIDTDFEAYSFKVDYAFPSFSITSASSYLDYSNGNWIDRIVAGTGDLLQTLLTAETVAQEILLNSSSDGAWRWSAGAMYRESEDTARQISPLPAANFSTIHESRSIAVFGEVTREFLDGKLEVTAGLRRFEDDVTETEPARPQGLPPAGVYGRNTFHATTPRVVVTGHPSDAMTVYASYSEGFRSGSSQPPNVLRVADFAPVKPDKLRNYEVGFKGITPGGVLSFDTAVYYIDWQDVQQALTVQHPSGLFAVITNGESASGVGVDLGLTAQATDNFSISGNVSWNDLTIDDDQLSGGLFLYRKGDRLSHSPEWTAGLSTDFSFPIGGGNLEARISASANYVSERDFRALAGGAVRQNSGDAMLISRLSIAVDSDRWTCSLFVDNANNESGSPIRQPFGPTATRDWDARVRPRTIGLQLEFRL